MKRSDPLMVISQCNICGVALDSKSQLSPHLRNNHPDVPTLEAYTLQQFFDGVLPDCVCGCGSKVLWHSKHARFNDCVIGHNLTIKQPVATANNPLAKRVCVKKAKTSILWRVLACDVVEPVGDRDILISEQDVLANGKVWTEIVALPALFKFLRAYVDQHGWIYPDSSHTLKDVILDLQQDGIHKANDFLKMCSQSFWDVDGGVRSSSQKDKLLMAVLKYRLGLNKNNETFDVTFRQIRYGFTVRYCSVSWFQPSTAFSVYREHLGNDTSSSPRVWDPSIGFSARLLGFASAFPNGHYVGTDPASAMFGDAQSLSGSLKQLLPRFGCSLHQCGSEVFGGLEPNTLDLVFTSPPYFDKERYYNEVGQCWLEYPVRGDWVTHYLQPTIDRAFGALKPGKRLVLNIGVDELLEVLACAASSGFSLLSQTGIAGKASAMQRANGIKKGPVGYWLVFEKPLA